MVLCALYFISIKTKISNRHNRKLKVGAVVSFTLQNYSLIKITKP